jgi:uncharacterized membrane protein
MRDVMLIVHFIGLSMGLGTSFAMFFLGRAAAKMPPADAGKFMMNASAVSKMGHIGLTLLFLSGGYLMTPYWSILSSSPILMAKLTLFLALGALVGIMSAALRRAKSGQPEQMLKVKKLGPVALITSVTIVILAVTQFH